MTVYSNYARNIVYVLKNTKTKFADDYFKMELAFDEKNELWEIVDNKITKDRDKKKH